MNAVDLVEAGCGLLVLSSFQILWFQEIKNGPDSVSLVREGKRILTSGLWIFESQMDHGKESFRPRAKERLIKSSIWC